MVDGYTVLSSVAAKVEKGLSAAADYVDEQISSFSWSDAQYAVPVWGEARMATNAYDRGNAYFAEGDYGYAAMSYVEALSWDIMGAANIATLGEASKVGALLDAGGELIAKGGRYLYGKFASKMSPGLIDDATGVLSKGDYLRIQNAATRINKPITVVGSRAKGTAGAFLIGII